MATAYAGDVSPQEAWDVLASDPQAVLVDVRTPPEWSFAGLPNLSSINKKTQTISWKTYPTFEVNLLFMDQLRAVVPNVNAPLYFLCKTGGRSADAAIAMTNEGYLHCYNIADGFEGDRDAMGRRGVINGWKASTLPWEQV